MNRFFRWNSRRSKSGNVDQVEIELAASLADDSQARSVWVPHGIVVLFGMIGHAHETAAVCVHHVDLVVPIAVARKGDALSVRLARVAVAGTLAMGVLGVFEYNFGDSEVLILYLFFATLPLAARRLEEKISEPA